MVRHRPRGRFLFPQNGRIPAIVDKRGGEEFPVFESGAILQYLCDRDGKETPLYPRDLKKRTVVNQWLMFQVCTGFVVVALVISFRTLARPTQQKKNCSLSFLRCLFRADVRCGTDAGALVLLFLSEFGAFCAHGAPVASLQGQLNVFQNYA